MYGHIYYGIKNDFINSCQKQWKEIKHLNYIFTYQQVKSF